MRERKEKERGKERGRGTEERSTTFPWISDKATAKTRHCKKKSLSTQRELRVGTKI